MKNPSLKNFIALLLVAIMMIGACQAYAEPEQRPPAGMSWMKYHDLLEQRRALESMASKASNEPRRRKGLFCCFGY